MQRRFFRILKALQFEDQHLMVWKKKKKKWMSGGHSLHSWNSHCFQGVAVVSFKCIHAHDPCVLNVISVQ